MTTVTSNEDRGSWVRYAGAVLIAVAVVLIVGAAALLPALSYADPQADSFADPESETAIVDGAANGAELPQGEPDALGFPPEGAGSEAPGFGSGDAPASEPLAVQAADVSNVRTEDELRQAVSEAAGAVSIVITQNLTLTSTIEIPAGKQVTISSPDGYAIAATSFGSRPMFDVAEGASLALGEGLVLNSAASRFVESAGLFALRGATLRGDGQEIGASFVKVSGASASLSIESGSIENCRSASDPVVLVSSGATGSMSGGSIKDNVSRRDAPLTILNASFEISGEAKITGNKCDGSYTESNGVGVRSTNSPFGPASLVMTGGTISGNVPYNSSSNAAGGVSVSGASDASGNSTFLMQGGTISNNVSNAQGGGVLSFGCAEFTMTGGTISGNEAKMGGGVSADNNFYWLSGQASTYEAYGTTAEQWTEQSPGAFRMLGGKIIDNTVTNSGGGIYSLSSAITLSGGSISGNTASWNGGGVYVSITPFSVTLEDVVITSNSAVLGGGAWFCPTGDVEVGMTDAAAVYGNSASGAGDDVAFSHTGNYSMANVSVVGERLLGGGPQNWYYDGKIVGVSSFGGSSLTNVGRGEGPRYAEAQTPYDHTWDGESSIALKAVPNEDSIALAQTRAKLFIQNNTAANGGGVGSNGHVYVGRAESKRVTVTKAWGVPADAQAHALSSVSVALEITGDDGRVYTVEHVTLDQSNDWTYVFEGLPHHAKVTIVEDELSDGGSGWVTYYSDTGEIDDTEVTLHENFNVTNARAGSLKLSKRVAGNAADKDQEFHYTVEITDSEGNPFVGRDEDGLPAEFSYEYSGGRSGQLKSGDEVSLKHGESVTISGIPHGARYEVHERLRDALGYEVEPVRNDGAVGDEAETGAITGDSTVEIDYTNEKWLGMGSLELSKEVAGDASDPSHEFSFIVRFYHADGSELDEGEFGYIGDREGFVSSGGAIVLSGGQRVLIEGLPAGTAYVVQEGAHEAQGYEIVPSDGAGNTGPDAERGVIAEDGTAQLSYTNVREHTMGALAISKEVAGAAGEGPADEFGFTLRLASADGADLDDAEFAYTGSREGVVRNGGTFSLKHGERIVVEGLPAGTRFQVEETAAGDYEPTYEGCQGTVEAAQTAEASVLNEKPDEPAGAPAKSTTPLTGDALFVVTAMLACMCALSALAAALALAIGRSYRP